MTNNIVPIGQARMPAGMRERVQSGAAVNKNFKGGLRDSFPRLSFSGKTFVIRMDGTTTVLRDPNSKYPLQFLDVVLLDGAEHLSKAYYASGYDESQEGKQPDCWSLDSVRPDVSVVNKINPTCTDCAFNQFGSAESRDPAAGKKGGKKCSDVRRVAVVMPGQLDHAAPLLFMLRVAATSLKNLKRYVDNIERLQWEPNGCVTRLEFDPAVTYPKILFNFIDGLEDDEYIRATELAASSYVKDMLRAPDFDMAESNQQQEQVKPEPEKPQPRQRQATPVMGDPEPSQQQAKPTQQKPDLHAVDNDDGLIELPDGQWFNPTTGEFVSRPEPKVDMPALDPDVMPLPDGRFFNRKLKAFVSAAEVGAKVIEAEAKTEQKPEKPPAKPRVKKAKAEPEAKVETKAEDKTEPKQEAKANGNGTAAADPAAKVGATPAAMDEMLRSVFGDKP